MAAATRQIAIRDLTPDSLLDFDLVTPNGTTILHRGQRLEKAVIDRWLALGFEKVLATVSIPSTQPLDVAIIEETVACTNATAQQLGALVEAVAGGVPASLADLAPVLDMIANVTLADRDAALWSVEKDIQRIDAADLQLAKRSAKFSLIAYGTALAHGLTPVDCEATAMAALLHDISLYSKSIECIQQHHRGRLTTNYILRQHSLLSAELVSAVGGLSDMTRLAILEVHEQIDGTGFPRGLRSEKISLNGRILNLVDAYLNLTDTSSPTGLIPPDAIAYLIKQTAAGTFDTRCMHSFLQLVSAYGIGAHVRLDDNSQAEVIRSSETDPIRPIIRLDNPSRSIIDLRHSKLAIKEPELTAADPRKRIKRTEMDEILWRASYLNE